VATVYQNAMADLAGRSTLDVLYERMTAEDIEALPRSRIAPPR
jgi:hypothetical protein